MQASGGTASCLILSAASFSSRSRFSSRVRKRTRPSATASSASRTRALSVTPRSSASERRAVASSAGTFEQTTDSATARGIPGPLDAKCAETSARLPCRVTALDGGASEPAPHVQVARRARLAKSQPLSTAVRAGQHRPARERRHGPLEDPANAVAAPPRDVAIGGAADVAGDVPAVPSEAPNATRRNWESESLVVSPAGNTPRRGARNPQSPDAAQVGAVVACPGVWVDNRLTRPVGRACLGGGEADSGNQGQSEGEAPHPPTVSVRHDGCQPARVERRPRTPRRCMAPMSGVAAQALRGLARRETRARPTAAR